MATGIGFVSEDTIPVIVKRYELISPEQFNAVAKEVDEKAQMSLTDYLKRFLGFDTNVRTETNTEFMKRVTRSMPRVTQKTVQSWHSNFRVLTKQLGEQAKIRIVD